MAIVSPRRTRTRTGPHTLALESLANVRDLGGLQGRAGQTLRWEQVYRADDLGRASAGDLAVLADAGLRTVIDLRSDAERRARPVRNLRGLSVEHHHLPLRAGSFPVGLAPALRAPAVDPVTCCSELLDAPHLRLAVGGEFAAGRPGPVDAGLDRARSVPGAVGGELTVSPSGVPDATSASLAACYLELMVEGAPAIADALRILAVPSAYPVVVHGGLGKDRVGVVVAVLLALLGVRDEAIAGDYHESELAFRGRPGPPVAAPESAMLALLDSVRGRGRSMVGYARSIGLSFDEMEAVHRCLLH